MTTELDIGWREISAWLASACLALWNWLTQRALAQHREHANACDAARGAFDERLRTIEQQAATREDVHRLRGDMQTGFGELRSEIREQMRMISELIQRGSR